jgi:hypothetical protein
MSKNWMMLTGLLFLGSVGTSQADPLDSPDIVYIDGLPCNSACQSYMAWSRQQTSSMAQQSAAVKPARRSSYSAIRHATVVHRESSKPGVHVRVAKQGVPLSPAKIAGLQPASDAAVASEPARANVVASPPAGGATATSNARTVQEQVAAATALAEHVTAASAGPVPQREANNAEASGRSEAAQTEPTASAPTKNTDNPHLARPFGPRSRQLERLKSSFNEGHTKAIDRLIGGEVPAAVLALVSPEAAEWFPDIPGYKIFRIPLSPRASKARL